MMNDFLKFILVNIGKICGVVLGFTLAVFLLAFGILKTLFIAALIVLGLILGKWHDEGVSFKKFIRALINSLRENKWR